MDKKVYSTVVHKGHLCLVLETKDKPRISYSEIRGYSEVYPRVKFWRFSNIFHPRGNYTEDNSAAFVNKYLIGQYGHVTWRDVVVVWHISLHYVNDQLA